MTPEQKEKINNFLDNAIEFQEEFLNHYPKGFPEYNAAVNEIRSLRSQKP